MAQAFVALTSALPGHSDCPGCIATIRGERARKSARDFIRVACSDGALMSHGYTTVNWTPFKRRFDAIMLTSMSAYLIAFAVGSTLALPANESFTLVQILIRGTGSLAFLMLTFVLCIGPLARLMRGTIPILYNRRHLGVATFFVALIHGLLVTVWYHGYGDLNPLLSLLVSNPRYGSFLGFPFEVLGLLALFFLFVMAATSHDFWNANLGPGVWKALHLSAYPAYVLLNAHVALGALQSYTHPLYTLTVAVGAIIVIGLHLTSSFFASGPDEKATADTEWLRVGPAQNIPEGRAHIVEPEGQERIAVFRFDGKVAAVSNVCRHQGGPLGEGRVIDGCITCPWHGYQYRPEDGCSPAPFTERITTYETRIEQGIVFVHRNPKPMGTAASPTCIEA
jgi:methionine sulfoxide reductase heme-binding subunit